MEDNFWFDLIEDYYKKGLYADSDLDIFVQGALITADQKTQILATKG